MKAIFLSYYYPPLKAPRATQVQRLVQHSQLPIRVLCAAEGAEPCRSDVDVKIFPDRSPRWWRLAKHLLYLPDGVRPWADRVARHAETDKLVGREDVLVTFGQPMSDHLAGLYLKQRIGMPWIAHFSDPWSDNPYLLPVPFARSRLRGMERVVFAQADRLLFTSQETVDLVMRKYPDHWRDKVEVLPHAYDSRLYGEPGEPLRAGEPLVLRYLGNFYRQRNPLLLASALAYLWREQPEILANVRVELVGRWVGHARWSPTTLGLPETVLQFRQPVGYRESLQLMRNAHALLVVDAPFEQNVFFPSKLVDYLGAVRPIIALTPPGTTADVVTALGGRVIPPDTPQRVAEGLADAIGALKAGAVRAAPPQMTERFSAHRVAQRFDHLVMDLTKQPIDPQGMIFARESAHSHDKESHARTRVL